MALSGIILHLIFANYFLQKFWYEPIFCFVLAPSKDLAVAPPYYYGILRQKVGALAFRPWRHCSHLAHYCVRLLAATFLYALLAQGVRTFLSPHRRAITHLACPG